jgi:ech hydrogenase subunit E
VLPEAIQFQLTCEDEKVVEVLPVIGYMHRGIEKAAEKNPFPDNVFLCERVCGICSFIHGATYCQVIEKMMDIQIPPRAEYLRVLWSELSRMHSHLLWLGLLADSFGFESLFMQCWRAREKVLDVLEITSGQRVIQSAAVIGGVRRDVNEELSSSIGAILSEFKREWDAILPVFEKDYTIRIRTVGKGILPQDKAWKLGAVGPTLRGSGWDVDMRTTGYGAYSDLDFAPVVKSGGDSYARMICRAREVGTSYELVRQVLGKLPSGEIAVKVNGFPNGEAVVCTEQPRGELFYYAKGNGTAYLERLKIRTPTFQNIVPLLTMLPGCELADVPVIVMSIDPCIACAER